MRVGGTLWWDVQRCEYGHRFPLEWFEYPYAYEKRDILITEDIPSMCSLGASVARKPCFLAIL